MTSYVQGKIERTNKVYNYRYFEIAQHKDFQIITTRNFLVGQFENSEIWRFSMAVELGSCELKASHFDAKTTVITYSAETYLCRFPSLNEIIV